MSNPANSLDQFETYLTHCVIAAFPNTPDAESADILLDKDLNMGDELPNSNGIVVVNDHRPSPTQVQHFNLEFCWRSIEPISSIMAGEITLADRNATGFIKFLKEKVVDHFGISLENITFAMRIFWVTAEAAQGGQRVFDSDKFYFSVSDVRHNTKSKSNLYMLPVVALYNTKMQLPNLCNMYNMTVTHKDGSLHKEIPTPVPSGGSIVPRAVEDIKYLPRRARLQKSKPMETLKEVFEALEADLNASTEIHQLQLQKWQEVVRDDYNFKLGQPVRQKKELPIKYTITLEDDYPSYKIDNRNLPFEQPNQKQATPGIRAIPTYPGETFYSLIDRIFSMTRRAGIDASNFLRPKVVATWQKIGDELHVDIVIRKHEIPNVNSGGGSPNPIEFFYRPNAGPPSEQNVDAYSILGKTGRNDLLHITEANPATEDGRVSYGGDRENITAERMQATKFFKAGYSGHRAFIANNKVMGVEFPETLGTYLQSGFTMQYLQDSDMVISIRGNPELMSDMFRPPSEVANGDPGNWTYYPRPEIEPMYVKFRIYYTPKQDLDSNFESELVDGQFYHEDRFMHLYKIENQMINGIFFQKLHMLRTDDLI